MNKRENLYWLRFSVSAYGEDGFSQLKAFREKLNAYNEKPLRQVYQDFDMVPTHVKKEDKVSAVGHIRVTTGDALYGFFHGNPWNEAFFALEEHLQAVLSERVPRSYRR